MKPQIAPCRPDDTEDMIAHLLEECFEVISAYHDLTEDANGKTRAHLAEELVDVETMAETILQTMGEHTADMAKLMVYYKNELRGYHD